MRGQDNKIPQDMGLAASASTALYSPLPLGEAARSIYQEMLDRYPELGKKDFSSVYRYLEQEAVGGGK